MKETFAILAALLVIIGHAPYLRDLLRRKIEPHAYTWFVWSIVSGITLAGQLVSGAGWGALPTAVAEAFTVLILVFSLRFGFKHITRTDTVFLIIALLGLIPWLLTKDPTLSVVIAVSIDLVAFVPTLRKAYLHPETETPLLYGTNVVRHVLSLLSLSSYNVATVLHSVAMLLANGPMTVILFATRFRKVKRPADENAQN